MSNECEANRAALADFIHRLQPDPFDPSAGALRSAGDPPRTHLDELVEGLAAMGDFCAAYERLPLAWKREIAAGTSRPSEASTR